MRDDGKVTYKKGVSAARHAIANGVPRWLTATPEWDALGQEICIDPRTGLPIGRISAPPELEAWQTAFIRGHNDEILRAIERGQIAVDFRPLLLTFPDVQKAFDLHRLGTLSLDHCQIEDPQGRFILHLDLPTPRQRRQAQKRKSEPCLWVVFERRSGERNARFLNFEEPIDVPSTHAAEYFS